MKNARQSNPVNRGGGGKWRTTGVEMTNFENDHITFLYLSYDILVRSNVFYDIFLHM